jgi:hypothetical protein
LFWEQRLGKNLVVIRSFRRYARILIVTAFSAFLDWCIDLAAEREDNVITLTGLGNKRKLALLNDDPKWVIFNHEGWRAFPDIYLYPWDVVIFDESTKIMNPKAKITKIYTKEFKQVPRRCILAGEPSPSGALNFFCQFKFLNGNGMLGCRNYYEFRHRFFRSDFWGSTWMPSTNGRKRIQRWIANNASVLKRSDVGFTDSKVYRTYLVRLTGESRKAYNQLEKEFFLEWNEIQKFTKSILTKRLWLRQLATGFVESKLVSGIKGKALRAILNRHRESAYIIFCQYRHEVEYVSKLTDQPYIMGQMSRSKLTTALEGFKNGEHNLVCQNDTVTFGTNLSRADLVIYFSNTNGFLTRVQTEDRCITIGCDTKLIYDILTDDSIDIDIYDGIRSRRNEQQINHKSIRRIQERLSK